MTIDGLHTIITYIGNGYQSSFLVNSELVDSSSITVYVNGVLQVASIDYNVSTQFGEQFGKQNVSSAYTVDFVKIPPLNSAIIFQVTTSKQQEVSYKRFSHRLGVELMEDRLDKLTLIAQELYDKVTVVQRLFGTLDELDIDHAIKNQLIKTNGLGDYVLSIVVENPPLTIAPPSPYAGKMYVAVPTTNPPSMKMELQPNPSLYAPGIPQLPEPSNPIDAFLVADTGAYKLWINIGPTTSAEVGGTMVLSDDLRSIVFKPSVSEGVLPLPSVGDAGKFGHVSSDDWAISPYTLPITLDPSDVKKIFTVMSTSLVSPQSTATDQLGRVWFNNSVLEGGNVTINSDKTSVTLSEAKAVFVSDSVGIPLTFTFVTFPSQSIPITLFSTPSSFLELNQDGTITESETEHLFQRGTKLSLCQLFHSDNTSLDYVVLKFQPANNLPSQIQLTMMMEGNQSPDINLITTGDFQIGHKGATFVGYNVNVANNIQAPHQLVLAANLVSSFSFIKYKEVFPSSSVVSAFPATPQVEDSVGNLTPLGTGQVAYYTVWLSSDNSFFIQYAQKTFTPSSAPGIPEYLTTKAHNQFLTEECVLVGVIQWEQGQTFLSGNVLVPITGIDNPSAYSLHYGDVDDEDKTYQVNDDGLPILGVRIPSPNVDDNTPNISEFDGLIPVYNSMTDGWLPTPGSGLLGWKGQGSAYMTTSHRGVFNRYGPQDRSPDPHFRTISDHTKDICSHPVVHGAKIAVEIKKFTLKNFIGTQEKLLRPSDWLDGIVNTPFSTVSGPFVFLDANNYGLNSITQIVAPPYFPNFNKPNPGFMSVLARPFTDDFHRLSFYIDSFYSVSGVDSKQGICVCAEDPPDYNSLLSSSNSLLTIPIKTSRFAIGTYFFQSMSPYQTTTNYTNFVCTVGLDLTKIKTLSAWEITTVINGTDIHTRKIMTNSTLFSDVVYGNEYKINQGTSNFYHNTGAPPTPQENFPCYGVTLDKNIRSGANSSYVSNWNISFSAKVPGTSVLPEKLQESRFEYGSLSSLNSLPDSDGIINGPGENLAPGNILVTFLSFGIRQFRVNGKKDIKPELRGLIINNLNQIADNTYPQLVLEKPNGTDPPVEFVEAKFLGGHDCNFGCVWKFENVTPTQFTDWQIVLYVRNVTSDVVEKMTKLENQLIFKQLP